MVVLILAIFVMPSLSGTSHFEAVIERLKQAQAEEYDEDDPMNLVGEDDEEGLPTHDINVRPPPP